MSRAWRDADFRVSFAKNKTHSYCYYSLTLKNIYGALPLANKFKEYHTGRDIYRTTMEYLAAFPVHFGVNGPDRWADKSPASVYGMLGVAAAVCTVVVLSVWMVAGARRVAERRNSCLNRSKVRNAIASLILRRLSR